MLEVRKQRHRCRLVGQCSGKKRTTTVKHYHLEWTNFDSVEGYATLKSSNESETGVSSFFSLFG